MAASPLNQSGALVEDGMGFWTSNYSIIVIVVHCRSGAMSARIGLSYKSTKWWSRHRAAPHINSINRSKSRFFPTGYCLFCNCGWLQWSLSKMTSSFWCRWEGQLWPLLLSGYKQDSHNTPIKFVEPSRTAHRPQDNILPDCCSLFSIAVVNNMTKGISERKEFIAYSLSWWEAKAETQGRN